MRIAKGYKVTNVVNNMVYYGIIYKDLDITRRFKQHMCGKGGVFLYREGVLKYGEENFKVEEVICGELNEVREWEYNQCLANLWPIGYNGNAGKAIIQTNETSEKRKIAYKKYIDNRTEEDIQRANEKRNITRNKRSSDQIFKTVEKLSAAGKKFWDNLSVEERDIFLQQRGRAKSIAYQEQSEETKQVIRDKIKNSMCKKLYKSPSGIHRSTVDGASAEGISPALFNYRCKSPHYEEYSILST
jgi:hypothetical protein